MKPYLAQLHQSGAILDDLVTWDGTTWVARANPANLNTLIEYASADSNGALLFRWGINTSGQPYFDAAGVTTGTEAALWRDVVTGNYFVEAITP